MSIFLLIIAALTLALGAHAAHHQAGVAKADYESGVKAYGSMYPHHTWFVLVRNFQLVGLTLILLYLATQYLRLA